MAVKEFVRILRTLPPSGLILDVRGNGGGYINFGERILQTLSPRPITPEPFHFVTSALALRLAATESWLTEWEKPLEMAISTGAGFSQGFPLTDPAQCNDIGQVYQGPVVLITDAFCYSTTDIFAAGFQDHGVGHHPGRPQQHRRRRRQRLGSRRGPAAAGAAAEPVRRTAWRRRACASRCAARRASAARSGVPLEDLGVVPDERYYMTRKDLLEGQRRSDRARGEDPEGQDVADAAASRRPAAHRSVRCR